MTNYFRNKPELKSFFILINYNNIRIDGAVVNFFQILQNMYPNKKFYNHMSIIWSFFDGVEDKTKMEQKKNGLKNMLKTNFPGITDEELNLVPQIFLNSIEARKPESPFREKINQLIDWSKELPPIINSLGKAVNVDKVIKTRIEEIENDHLVNENENNGIKILVYCNRKRYKQIHYDLTESYSDYEEIPRTRKTKESRVHTKTVSGPHKVEINCHNHVKKVFGVCVSQYYEHTGYYYVMRVDAVEERIGLHDENGIPQFGEWVEKSRGPETKVVTDHYCYRD